MAQTNLGRFAPDETPPGRRNDLDWIRIGAFALLILYHLAMYFGPWSWHLNSRGTVDWLGVAMVASNPWRLGLLFLVSGVAVRHMTRKVGDGGQGVGGLMSERSRRLLLPLLFGAVVLVPPQAYLEQVVNDGLAASYLAFWPRFLLEHVPQLDGTWSPPPLNHLWFISYIWAYSLIAVALLWAPRLLEALQARLGGALGSGAGVLVVPTLYLVTARFALFPTFGVTNHLTWDPYNHATSLALFLTGFLLAFRTSFWASVERVRWPALLIATAATAMLGVDALRPVPQQHPAAVAAMAAFAVAQWSTIVTVLGFGRRHLSALDGPALVYLREAVFPFYLLHQTIIVIAAYALRPLDLPLPLEALGLLAITLLGCVAGFEAVRRTPWLGPCLGLRPSPRRRPADARARPVDLTLRQRSSIPATK
ncbi:acyltransferase family protein [Phenylobacterium sp. LjRoot219]|uniref:acyltransferase family protein n=1 Tax=Phenylobacterium sp. LjRoot219 TaxID=3342283 RepID=UPI003ECF5C1B